MKNISGITQIAGSFPYGFAVFIFCLYLCLRMAQKLNPTPPLEKQPHNDWNIKYYYLSTYFKVTWNSKNPFFFCSLSYFIFTVERGRELAQLLHPIVANTVLVAHVPSLSLNLHDHFSYEVEAHRGNLCQMQDMSNPFNPKLGRRQWQPTPSSTVAWKIPWMEEPRGLQSRGSRRVGQDWATSLSRFTFMHWRRKWQPTPVFLPGESQGRGSLVGCCLCGHRESDTTEVT